VSDIAALGAYPKTVVLNDGAHLALRLAVPADAPALASLGRHLPPEMCWGPADDPLGSTSERGPARAFAVVACDGARVVGAARLMRPAESSRAREAHVASLAVGLDPAYHGRRLGTWMLLDCVHLASALDIELLVARAHPKDEAYLAALRRLDFVDDATLRDRYGVLAARAAELLTLVKAVHRKWTDF
jgi:RimJ/RimL family protein N-acetyltransferase